MIGRKRRQNVRRQPDGRVAPEKGLDPKAIAQLMPHRRLVPANVAHDPKAESELGRLCLNGWITEVQYQAGVKYREIVQRYRVVIDCPRSTEVSMSGVIVGPWGSMSPMDDSEAERRKANYDAAFEYLEAQCGNSGARAVAHCVMQDKQNAVIVHLKCGLTALAEHFGLTFARKSGLGINAR